VAPSSGLAGPAGGRGPLPLLRDGRVITLYQDWLPFGLALGYVVVHHSVLGLLDPTGVFNHPAAQRAPLRWALIHGAFVLAASLAYLVTGVPNRRVWDEELPRELERARRMRTGLCVAMDFQEAGAELVARADQGLYVAKAEGRNRHVLA
jgi:hypothetical protein